MMSTRLSVLYYRFVQEAAPVAAGFLQRGVDVVADAPGGFPDGVKPPVYVDADVVEEAARLMHQRFAAAPGFYEKSLILEWLFTHYQRVIRYFAALDPSRESAIFLHHSARNAFDLAFRHGHETTYFQVGPTGPVPIREERELDFRRPPRMRLHVTAARLRDYFFDGVPPTVAPLLEAKVVFAFSDNSYGHYVKPCLPLFNALDARRVSYRVHALNDWAARFLAENRVSFVVSAPTEPVPKKIARMVTIDREVRRKNPCTLFDAMLNLALGRASLKKTLQIEEISKRIPLDGCTSLFLAPDGTPAGLWLAADAARRGVSTWTLVSSTTAPLHRAMPLFHSKNICVCGTGAQGDVRELFPDRNVVLVGNPNLYRYVGKKPAAGKPTILVGTSGDVEDELVWMRHLLDNVPASRATIVIKPHPFHASRYAPLSDGLNGHNLLDATVSVEDLVGTAKLVITDHSTLGRDAHLLGKHVISMTLSKPLKYLNDVRTVRFANSCASLLEHVELVLAGPDDCEVDPEFITRENWGNSPRCHETIVEQMLATAPR